MKTLYRRYVNGDEIGPREFLAFAVRPASMTIDVAEAPQAIGESRILALTARDEFGLAAKHLRTVETILLHGSQASRDAVAFSDMDVAVVLDDLTRHAPEAVKRDILTLRRLCLSLLSRDPLMHHGLMFVTRSKLLAYDEMFLPVATLARAIVVCGPPRLAVTVVPGRDLEACARRLRATLARLRAYDFTAPRWQDDYSVKAFVSTLLLVPALFLAAKGRFVAKQASFEEVYSGFPMLAWDAVKSAEALRKEWTAPRRHPLHAVVLPLLGTQAQRLMRRFYRDNWRAYSERLQHLVVETAQLQASLEAVL